MGRLERGESGVTVWALATILAALGVSLSEFFEPFGKGGEAKDASEDWIDAGLSPNGNPLPYPFGRINSWNGG